MKFPLEHWGAEALKRRNVTNLQHFICSVFFLGTVFSAQNSRAQFAAADTLVARSISGQFVVTAAPIFSPLFYRRDFAANTNFIRLEPALLAISAERFKGLLWDKLGLKPNSPWRGKIFLVVRPAQSPDDGVVIAAGSILQAWDYRVTLPDILTRTRYARTLSDTLLLEIANRGNPPNARSAEIPAWLADGLACEVLVQDSPKIILSAPAKIVDGLPQTQLDEKVGGFDSLASARKALRNSTALTFDELSWPTDEQVNGDDGGAYLASAQLFVHDLLKLKNGPEKVRALLARLPDCLNWQVAFYAAFHDDFPQPVEVEKWWSLRVVDFAAHNVGSQWTIADSNDELANLLSVPVEIRDTSNSLPAHAEISLQSAISNFTPEDRDAILWAKLRDIELAQFRVAPSFAVLTAGYRNALADFLGDRKPHPPAQITPVQNFDRQPSSIMSKHGTTGGIIKSPSTDFNTTFANYLAGMKNNPQLLPANKPQADTTLKPANAGGAPKKVVTVYHATPADFPEETPTPRQSPTINKRQTVAMLKRASIEDTLKKLDALDVRRRALILQLKLDSAPRNVASSAP
jgi:hypothetical protein